MNNSLIINRRQFLQYTGLGIAAFGLPSWLQAMQGMDMPRMPPNKASASFNPDVEIDLICQKGEAAILPGQATRVSQYVGKLVKGPEGSVVTIPGSYLGPILRLRTGQKVRINLRNEMDEPTITHWHGLNVPALMDGHPMYAVDKGQTFVYEFEVRNRASMILYHPHTHERTAEQVYQGLAGAILINDEEEEKLKLPSGEYEIPIVIQDRSFDVKNQFVYVHSNHDRMTGFHGDQILVNGKPNVTLEVANRAYRLRVLNGSNARIYKLAWDDGSPMVVLGVDGGLLEQPEHKPYIMLAPGERLDVWADFSGKSIGSQLVMRSKPFKGVLPKMAEQMMSGGGMGMMGGMNHQADGDKKSEGGQGMGGMGMMGGMNHQADGDKKGEDAMEGMKCDMAGMMGHKLPVGSDYPIFTVKVTKQASDSPSLPSQLSKFTRYTAEDTANPTKPIPVGLSEGPMSMLINGRPYAYNDIQPNERIPFGTIQLMEIFHAHGGEGGHGGGDGKAAAEGHGGDAPKPAEGQAGEMQHGAGGGGMGMMGGMGGQGGGMQHGMMGGGMGMMGGMGGGGMNHQAEGDKKPESAPAKTEGGHDMAAGGGAGMAGGGMGGMGGGMMFSMAHPIHFHEHPFQILSRTIGAEEAEDYATVKDGFINSGLKDTVLIMPGEKVRLIKTFKDYKGLYMVHCHNLEHEDMGMMREFLVE